MKQVSVECVHDHRHASPVRGKPAYQPAFRTMCVYDLWFKSFYDLVYFQKCTHIINRINFSLERRNVFPL